MTIDYFYFWIELFKQNTCFVSILHKCKFSSKVRALEIPCPMELAADLLRLPHNPPGQLLVNFNLGRIISLLHSRGLLPWRQLVKNFLWKRAWAPKPCGQERLNSNSRVAFDHQIVIIIIKSKKSNKKNLKKIKKLKKKLRKKIKKKI